jgi:hypothetical protein
MVVGPGAVLGKRFRVVGSTAAVTEVWQISGCVRMLPFILSLWVRTLFCEHV